MARIPQAVQSLLDGFSNEFSSSVWQRFVSLLTAAIMVRGRRTIWRLLCWSGVRVTGHFSSFHRVFSHRRWSSHALAKRLAWAVVARFVPEGPLELVGDDTVSQHRGENVYGKGCHRDAMRCGRAISIWFIAGDTNGWCSRCVSGFPVRSEPGRSRCWSPCIALPKQAIRRVWFTRRPPS
jgi:hypothetical protein